MSREARDAGADPGSKRKRSRKAEPSPFCRELRRTLFESDSPAENEQRLSKSPRKYERESARQRKPTEQPDSEDVSQADQRRSTSPSNVRADTWLIWKPKRRYAKLHSISELVNELKAGRKGPKAALCRGNEPSRPTPQKREEPGLAGDRPSNFERQPATADGRKQSQQHTSRIEKWIRERGMGKRREAFRRHSGLKPSEQICEREFEKWRHAKRFGPSKPEPDHKREHKREQPSDDLGASGKEERPKEPTHEPTQERVAKVPGSSTSGNGPRTTWAPAEKKSGRKSPRPKSSDKTARESFAPRVTETEDNSSWSSRRLRASIGLDVPALKRSKQDTPDWMRSRQRRARSTSSGATFLEPIYISDDEPDGDDTCREAEAATDDAVVPAAVDRYRKWLEDSSTTAVDSRAALTTEEIEALEATMNRSANKKLVLSEIHDAKIKLRREDFLHLDGESWLHDEVINSYVALVNRRNAERDQERNEAPPRRPRVHCFNTYFFTKLNSARGTKNRYDYQSVKRWTAKAKVDVLERDLIIVPVNLQNYHWVCAYIDMRSKSFIYLDSMHKGDHRGVLDSLQRWIRDEVCDKHDRQTADRMDFRNWKKVYSKSIPRQGDGGSCGVFLAIFMDRLERGMDMDFSQKDIPALRKRIALELLAGSLLET